MQILQNQEWKRIFLLMTLDETAIQIFATKCLKYFFYLTNWPVDDRCLKLVYIKVGRCPDRLSPLYLLFQFCIESFNTLCLLNQTFVFPKDIANNTASSCILGGKKKTKITKNPAKKAPKDPPKTQNKQINQKKPTKTNKTHWIFFFFSSCGESCQAFESEVFLNSFSNGKVKKLLFFFFEYRGVF